MKKANFEDLKKREGSTRPDPKGRQMSQLQNLKTLPNDKDWIRPFKDLWFFSFSNSIPVTRWCHVYISIYIYTKRYFINDRDNPIHTYRYICIYKKYNICSQNRYINIDIYLYLLYKWKPGGRRYFRPCALHGLPPPVPLGIYRFLRLFPSGLFRDFAGF